MATTYRTSTGDLLDTLCYRHYGHLMGTLEVVLDANQGLADIPQPFPAGVLIRFPDMSAPSDLRTVQLWE